MITNDKDKNRLQLPKLIGSPKQVAWAESIRERFVKQGEQWIKYLENPGSSFIKNCATLIALQPTIKEENHVKNLISVTATEIKSVMRKAQSNFWIDNRDKDLVEIIRSGIFNNDIKGVILPALERKFPPEQRWIAYEID